MRAVSGADRGRARIAAVAARGPARRLAWLLALCLVLLSGPVGASSAVAGAWSTPATAPFAGWAMDAYPGDSVDYLRAEMQRQLAAGANVVWLGQDNPGEVGIHKREPALSYAVWAAYANVADPHHADAVAMLRAQTNALDAARSLGVRVVFPIGYQTQMGAEWNLAHPEAARRLADNSVYNGPDPTNIGASFYAPVYQSSILAYYRWLDAAIVRPYSDTIMMLNLADEPKDGDYSTWADAAFRAANGFGLREAGRDPVRQEAVGRFEADYVADYAAWSARQWLAIDPEVKVTVSFCGGYARYLHEGPDIEAIFREAPPNFVVTFDAYPKDGLYTTPLHDADLIELFSLIRTLGYYSSVYRVPLWLWSTANSWGLNGASPDPGSIADAVANAIYLAQLARQSGGDLQGIAVWNYNIKGQGLYNDTHALTYEPDQMFARVSAAFPLLHALMAAAPTRPTTAIVAPNGPTLRLAGATLALRATDQFHWDALAAVARADVPAIEVTHLDVSTLPDLHTALVLTRARADLAPAERAAYAGLLKRGGIVVASWQIARVLAGPTAAARLVARGGRDRIVVWRLATPRGRLLAVSGGPVEDVFSDANAAWAAPVWLLALDRTPQTTGYTVSFGGVTLLYTIAAGGAHMTLALPATAPAALLTTYDTRDTALTSRRIVPTSGSVRLLVPRRGLVLAISR